MELTSEQQRVMDVEYQQHDAFNYPQEALYAAGAALLEYEYHRWIITLSAFRKDLDAHNLHGHYNLFQEHFAEFFPAPAEGAKAEGQAQPLKVAFKRSNRVTANQQAFEDAEYAAPRVESQDNVENLRKSAELCRTLEAAIAQLRLDRNIEGNKGRSESEKDETMNKEDPHGDATPLWFGIAALIALVVCWLFHVFLGYAPN